MGDIQLATPRLRVVRDGHDPLEVQVTNADLVRWDRTRYRHKWPPMSEAPFIAQTFLSWCAARRTGAIPHDLAYEVWEETCLEVVEVKQPADQDPPGGPTPEDPESG